MAELADAPDSGSGGVTLVRVQVPPFAPSVGSTLCGGLPRASLRVNVVHRELESILSAPRGCLRRQRFGPRCSASPRGACGPDKTPTSLKREVADGRRGVAAVRGSPPRAQARWLGAKTVIDPDRLLRCARRRHVDRIRLRRDVEHEPEVVRLVCRVGNDGRRGVQGGGAVVRVDVARGIETRERGERAVESLGAAREADDGVRGRG